MSYSDNPLKELGKDDVGRAHFCDILTADLLKNGTDPDHSITVGVYGEWGSGKTTILNVIENKINGMSASKEIPLVVRFDPWNYTDREQLLTQFFEQLLKLFDVPKKRNIFRTVIEALTKYNIAFKIAKLVPGIGDYVDLVDEAVKNADENYKKKAEALKNISVQKKAVADALKKHKQKILVIVDDIDRLANDQICMIFQLVKSIADFPYMTYLMAFDRAIVARALQREQNCDGEAYLKKIVQLLLPIPDMPKELLNAELFRELSKELDEEAEEYFVRPYWFAVSPFILEQLTTMRDVKRLLNAFKTQYLFVKGDVCFIDLLAVVTLQQAHPEIIAWILSHQDLLLGNNVDDNLLPGKTKEEAIAALKAELSALCPSAVFRPFLANLFPWFGNHALDAELPYDLQKLAHAHRIAYPLSFPLYFTMTPDPLEIWQEDLIQSLNTMDESKLQSFFDGLSADRRLKICVEKLSCFIDDIPEDRLSLIFGETLRIVRRYANEDTAECEEEQKECRFERNLFDTCEECAVKLLKHMDEKTQEASMDRAIRDVSNETLPLLLDLVLRAQAGNLPGLRIPETTLEAFLRRLKTRAGEISKHHNILETAKPVPVINFMQAQDPASFTGVVERIKESPLDMAKVISYGTQIPSGPNDTYEYNPLIKGEFLSDSDAYRAVKPLLVSMDFDKLPKDVRQNTAAFAMMQEGRKTVAGRDVNQYLKTLKTRS